MTKQALRKIYLKKRIQLSGIEHKDLSQQLCDYFFSFVDLSQIKVVHIFLPIKKNNEPNTWLIIDRLKKEYPSIKISIPKVVGEDLVHYYLDSDCILEETKWGITEPTSGNLTEVPDIDLVLVPLLAFDKEGNRVGYGKGFYDKFLIKTKKGCKRIGLSLFSPTDPIDNLSLTDICLTSCIDPFEFHNFME